MRKSRVNSVDLLRGIMAISVMIYHYFSWSVGGLDATSIWSRFGLYAVSVFYFISGFSLAYVYWDDCSFKPKEYLLRRFFRIAPLFYFVSILALVNQFFKTSDIEILKIFLNFTFLFAVIDPSAYYSTGSWSIGNEMFFYAIFALILASRKRTGWLCISVSLSLLSLYYFREVSLSDAKALSNQWALYIHPLNHALCFLFGVCTYAFNSKLHGLYRSKAFYAGVIGVSILIFVYPISGDRINLVTGIETALLLLSSYCIFLLFLMNNDSPIFNTKASTLLGDISFSIYLVHPFCWYAIKKVYLALSIEHSGILFWGPSILFTILVSYTTYRFVEKSGIAYGKKFIKKYV